MGYFGFGLALKKTILGKNKMEKSWREGEYYFEMSDMVGRVFSQVTADHDELRFVCDEGTFVFYHEQDCCESVSIESIVGDLEDLVGEEMLMAEDVENIFDLLKKTHEDEDEYGSKTWTFYKFATRKGYVDVRWIGESNGYYSESVDLKFIPNEKSGRQNDSQAV